MDMIDKKKLLIVYYSQSGQLKKVLDRISEGLLETDSLEIDYFEIKMEKDYPFPWQKDVFFDAFPETFSQISQPFLPPAEAVLNKKYDLIILGYQVWYLTPSIPINSFLKSDVAKKLLHHTPVVTISGSRNMWVLAQEKVKSLLKENQATLVGNIALVDRNINLISVITLVKWMFTGKQDKLYGIFPKPGISPQEIEDSIRFGRTLQQAIKFEEYSQLQDKLLAQGAIEIRHFLVSMDRKANTLFAAWAKLILNSKAARRPLLLKFFNVYLFVAIWFISPIVHLIHTLTYPLKLKQIRKDKAYFEGVK